MDATLSLLNTVYNHLETPKSYVRILFVDFSSAFNTIQPHILLGKLIDMGVNSHLIKWIEYFLKDRRQYVKVNGTISNRQTISTGAPQGCVISPVLFTLYTNDCVSSNSTCLTFKFADDAAIVGKLNNAASEELYRQDIDNFTTWCRHNHLVLNVTKTKELIIDFRNKPIDLLPVRINNETVEIVTEYKYLGTFIDSKLNWRVNTENLYNKCQQRLHLMRKLRSFNVNTTVMSTFYVAFIQSILTFSFHCWYGSLSVQQKTKVDKIVNIASKIAGVKFECLSSIYERQILNQAVKIISDPSHFLHSEYSLLPSGRRYKIPMVKTKRTRTSFISETISLLNK